MTWVTHERTKFYGTARLWLIDWLIDWLVD
jgi:hypothetical protein